MSKAAETMFDEGVKRYQAGETAQTLIPVFKEICDRSPKNSAAWTSLAWLYLLESKPNSAYKAALKAVKLNPDDPQARINLAAAMLETNRKGVREHVDRAQTLIMGFAELREEVKANFADGLSRKPDWQHLKQIEKWLFEL
ncbi:MAG: tetratricopeptide repeat protein [Hormoscilla sp.]